MKHAVSVEYHLILSNKAIGKWAKIKLTRIILQNRVGYSLTIQQNQLSVNCIQQGCS